MVTIMNIITIITTTITTTIMLKKTFFEGHFWRAQKVDELRIGDQKKKAHAKHLEGGWRKKNYEGESALCRKP